ncbi:2Fe-2S iron-sulfur cluster-binding protein, partial [Streptomyces sp. NPDC002454]
MTTSASTSYEAHFRIWRGDAGGGALGDFRVEVNEGEVVLDIIHRLQATQAPDLAVRWNCKAGKCGSCSAEINGRPRLLCMTRMSVFDPAETVTVTPLRAFPVASHNSGARERRYSPQIQSFVTRQPRAPTGH